MADDPIEITDDNVASLALLIIGRKIVAFKREPSSGEDWSRGENSVTITLDDGSQLLFVGYGYDASGLRTHYTPPNSTKGG